jgi:hypothetical protein
MSDWEADPDAWKKENPKPWEEADGWKLEDGYEPGETEAKRDPRVMRSMEWTLGVQPTVDVTYLEWDESTPPTITVKDRDALKVVAELIDMQKAVTEEKELFQYSRDRNMWVRIPWEAV